MIPVETRTERALDDLDEQIKMCEALSGSSRAMADAQGLGSAQHRAFMESSRRYRRMGENLTLLQAILAGEDVDL